MNFIQSVNAVISFDPSLQWNYNLYFVLSINENFASRQVTPKARYFNIKTRPRQLFVSFQTKDC